MSERVGKVERSKSSWWFIQYTPDSADCDGMVMAIKTKYKTKRAAVARAQDYLSKNLVDRLIVRKAPKPNPMHGMHDIFVECGLVWYED